MADENLSVIAAEWHRVAPRLLRFVRNRIGMGLLPKGHDAEDVVQMAFERLVSGARAWDAKQVDLETHMKQSILRSMLGSKGLPAVKDTNAIEFTDEEDIDHLDENGVRISEVPRDSIPEMDKAAALTALETEIEGDRELEDVLAAIRMGCWKPGEIAEMTGIDVKRIYWLQQKLAARAEKARSTLHNRPKERQ